MLLSPTEYGRSSPTPSPKLSVSSIEQVVRNVNSFLAFLSLSVSSLLLNTCLRRPPEYCSLSPRITNCYQCP